MKRQALPTAWPEGPASGLYGSGGAWSAGRDPTQEIGQLDGELDPFADLVSVRGVFGGTLQLAELGQQELEALGQELLTESPVLARPREIGVCDQK
jgi:hypothetical protein